MDVSMMGMWLQDAVGLTSSDTRLLTIFVGLVALAMLIQACVVLALGIGALKAQKKLLAVVDELKVKAMPVIASAQTVVREATPKVRVVVDNVVETTHVVRRKAQEIEVTLTDANQKVRDVVATVGDANQRTRGQISRVDGMVTATLKATSELGATIHHSIQVPAKQVAGIVTGVKVGLESFFGRSNSGPGGRVN